MPGSRPRDVLRHSVLDRLAQTGSGRRQSDLRIGVEELKQSVRRDIEWLLNSRRPLLDLSDLPEAFPVSTGFHHMGTIRMSSAPSEGVVDGDCRVHSVSNLFVGGSGVFTTSSVSPPTFTIVALAIRLAEHLRTRVLS